jgi:hypothetical protein
MYIYEGVYVYEKIANPPPPLGRGLLTGVNWEKKFEKGEEKRRKIKIKMEKEGRKRIT